MRVVDAYGRMAELEFEAPLAQLEDVDDLKDNGNDPINPTIYNFARIKDPSPPPFHTDTNIINDNNEEEIASPKKNNTNGGLPQTDNFTETFSGSLEDLVNTFDEKITKCFGNYEENVEKLAPVQVRTQEEIMNECQMWWTLTGNFGNILPIDWTKSFSRKMHIPTLNLTENKKVGGSSEEEVGSSEDEAVAGDLDMHALILGGLHHDHECPVKTADEVIQEIDDMMQETPSSEGDLLEYNEALEKGKEMLSSPLYEDKLRQYSMSQLTDVYMELESLIREFSETLIAELALRDELEYEKELKNTFISLLLAVQDRRRTLHQDRRRKGHSKPPQHNDNEYKYLTTVIPYHIENGPPDNQTLQALIKILKAINEDSPTVPTLLTDYILKVLVPTYEFIKKEC